MTCKDCLYYEACVNHYTRSTLDYIHGKCEGFTNRSEWVHLPCKVGDTVYIPKDDGTISESKVARIDITFMMDTGKNAPFDTWWLNEYNLGITSFLTREEAEKALAGNTQ